LRFRKIGQRAMFQAIGKSRWGGIGMW